MLEERCAAIEVQVARVAPRIPAIHAAYLEKLAARLREAGLDPDEERLKQELALFATKIDVAEELSAPRRRTSPRCGACSRPAAAPASGSIS